MREHDSFADRVEMMRYAEMGRAFLEGQRAQQLTPLQQVNAVEKAQQIEQQMPRRVVTVHSRYGQPPGDLAYVETQHWTPEQVERGNAWLRNCMAADWWRAQGQAQREAS